MSCVGDQTDVTVQLPDEVLCHIFSFLSLSQKLRLESVNHKFQRCILKALKAIPQRLNLELLNQSRDIDLYPVQMLAKKAKFGSICLYVEGAFTPRKIEKMDRLLSLLISENQCLPKVTSFSTDSGCSQAIMENFLGKCAKLSRIKFNFETSPVNAGNFPVETFPLDLHQLFKNRGLTELVLRPNGYHQKGLTDMLEGIQPNTLKKLDLWFDRHLGELNIVELVNALGPNGSALEEIQLFGHIVLRVQLAHLFESLSRLPALRKCDIEFTGFTPENQFVAAMTSLFFMSDINITVTTHEVPFLLDVPGCQAVNMIRQVQDVHPGLVVDFGDRGHSLVLKLGKATMLVQYLLFICEPCDAEDCAQCQSFYLSLLSLLRSRADNASHDVVETQHFPNWHLDRCRVHRVVADLNYMGEASVVPNEYEQTVTINFAVRYDVFLSITVGYGRCLTIGCKKCEN